jgi:hypothetical protein
MSVLSSRHDFVDVFYQSLSAWRSETAHSSFAEDKTASPHFKKIVSLGEHVVPLIVNELSHEPSFLFLALEEITGHDPIRTTIGLRCRSGLAISGA